MSLHEQLAEQMDFAEPGYLREKPSEEGIRRYLGMTHLAASFVCRLDEALNQSFLMMLKEQDDEFLIRLLPETPDLPKGGMVSQRISFWFETSAGDFVLKFFVALKRTDTALEHYAYIVHPEEMDILLRAAYGRAYDTLVAPQDDRAI